MNTRCLIGNPKLNEVGKNALGFPNPKSLYAPKLLEVSHHRVRADHCRPVNVQRVSRDRMKPEDTMGIRNNYGHATNHPQGIASDEKYPLDKPKMKPSDFYYQHLVSSIPVPF